MIIFGGTCYFVLHHVRRYKTKLPHRFTGPLNSQGTGCITIRYGGWSFPVAVRHRILGSGWRRFLNHANVTSGSTLLVGHSFGRVISILKFTKGTGIRVPWEANAHPFDVESAFVEEDEVPEDALTQTYRTSYYPKFMSLFFARPSGVRTYQQPDYMYMRMPRNLAQHLRLNGNTQVNIRSGERVFESINVSLGYFRGQRWSDMVRSCDFEVGFKIFFFLNGLEEFEMIVIGHDYLEAVYEWSRSYYRLL